MFEIAVITPYYKESLDTLKRNIDSVKAQSFPNVSHYLVSDGHPIDEIDRWGVKQHLKIPTHNDFGDTPRAIGSASAATLGVDAIIFLDADCWLEADHVEKLKAIHDQTKAQVVTATRMLRRTDGSVLGVCNESNGREFNDTNCYFLTKPAFPAIAAWIFKDRRESIVGDRRFWKTIQDFGYSKAHCIVPTINYTTNFAFHYQMCGQVPPDTTKVIVRFGNEEYSRTVSFLEYKRIIMEAQNK